MKRIHFVGIKGVAMTALAIWYKEAGYQISGSDVADTFPTDEVLEKAGITVVPFSAANIDTFHPDIVIYTGAHNGRDNAEVVAAIQAHIPTLPHGKALGEVMRGKRQISVAGSHGKTTTSAMIACILANAGRDPSWTIGCGMIRGLGLPGHFGTGDIFVAEADEYVTDPGRDQTPRFMWQHPEILVVTNIEFDHPDAYASLADVVSAFNALEKQSKQTIYSRDIHVSHIGFGSERTFFTLERDGMKIHDFTLKVPGKHNAQNAATAATVAHELGLSWDQIAEGLLAFGGTKRRFEFVGKAQEATVIDDYAHHPSEIKATIAAAREWYPKEHITVVFQPHTYSRTSALLKEFSQAFGQANTIIFTDIYASAREQDTLGVTTGMLVEETAKHHANVLYAPGYTEVKNFLLTRRTSSDIIIFMGAGDIYAWSKRFTQE